MTTINLSGIQWEGPGQVLHRGNYGPDGVIVGQFRVIGEITACSDTGSWPFTADITDAATYNELIAMSAQDAATALRMWDGEWWAVPWAGGCFDGGEQAEWGDIITMGCALLAGHDGDHHIP